MFLTLSVQPSRRCDEIPRFCLSSSPTDACFAPWSRRSRAREGDAGFQCRVIIKNVQFVQEPGALLAVVSCPLSVSSGWWHDAECDAALAHTRRHTCRSKLCAAVFTSSHSFSSSLLQFYPSLVTLNSLLKVTLNAFNKVTTFKRFSSFFFIKVVSKRLSLESDYSSSFRTFLFYYSLSFR